MTQEQRDWYIYGALKFNWLTAGKCKGIRRVLAQAAWDARKKAHRWLDSGCDDCKFSELKESEFPCGFCTGNKGYWQPKDG